MKRIFFIGNRYNVFKQILDEPDFELSEIWVMKDSFLEKELSDKKQKYQTFKFADRQQVHNAIAQADFDILISNGCPFILPISKLQKPHQLFINTHPSYLPYLRGTHPINGIFMTKMKFFGATTHYMVDEVDAGNILAQAKIVLTPDLDLGLVYRLAFTLEGEVFKKAIQLLKKNHYQFKGKPLPKIISTFARTPEDRILDVQKMVTDKLLLRIRAFGIHSQGCILKLSDRSIQIFAAEPMSNPYLLKQYQSKKAGDVLLSYDEKLVLKTLDGVVKITDFTDL